ncbi:TorF family putative porin [Variovorax sp. GT1P44]|uniref:TorF family putative porin n=1 Tax=Variovorax sp. GT1P44 TaxID=3443742 RepID=UPI003F47DCC6
MLTAAGLRVALGPSLLVACGAAFAQTGGSITFFTDYRYRGVSLSDERPTLSLSLAHDDPSGWYGGASLTGVSLYPSQRELQVLGYAGYAGRFSERLGWEAGGTFVHYGGDSRYDFGEAFAGLSGERWNTRLHYAPDYFGSGTRTVYGEVNLGIPLSPITRATAHLGYLARVGGARSPTTASGSNLDGSVGLAVARDAWEVRLDWIGGGRSGFYPTAYGRAAGSALVLSASLSF